MTTPRGNRGALDLNKVADYLRAFAVERDWEQFHNPKNLAMALAAEAGELLEIFQWLTPDESVDLMVDQLHSTAVEDELADILQYVIRLADVLGVDLDAALWRKLEENGLRYPADEVRGRAVKWTDLGDSL